VLDRTAYPEAPTIYGPGLQAIFALCSWLAPAKLWGWKAALWLAQLCLCLTLSRGNSDVADRRAWLALMAPPMFFEFGLNAHPDLIAIALMALAYRCGTPAVAGALMALCVACRVQGYILLPFFLWAWPWSGRLSFVGTLAVLYAPLLLVGSATEWTGIAAFSQQWEFNSSLSAVLGSSSWSMVVAAVICAVAFAHWARAGGKLERCPGAFCIACVLIASPVFNPWYALWMLPFLATQPGSLWRYAWLALPSLSYITVGNLGHDLINPFAHPAWLRPAEFGLLAVASYLASRGSAASQSASSSTSRQALSSVQHM
jgi:alpha-1,6-mannosyltransferase